MKSHFIFSLALVLTLPVILEKDYASFSYPSVSEDNITTLRLFDGKSLDGWYTYLKGRGRNVDPNEVFTVANGMIRISGEEFGCLTTNDEFGNYELNLMFKWGEITHPPRIDKARDSGILLHSVGEDGASSESWMYSIECQIIEGGTGDLIIVGDGSQDFSITSPVAEERQGSSYIFQPSGNMVTINRGRINWLVRDPDWKDIKGFRGANDVEKAAGKWNRIKCIVKGREISVYLNGRLVNQAVDVKPARGRIQIQSEGAEIFLKRISVILL